MTPPHAPVELAAPVPPGPGPAVLPGPDGTADVLRGDGRWVRVALADGRTVVSAPWDPRSAPVHAPPSPCPEETRGFRRVVASGRWVVGAAGDHEERAWFVWDAATCAVAGVVKARGEAAGFVDGRLLVADDAGGLVAFSLPDPTPVRIAARRGPASLSGAPGRPLLRAGDLALDLAAGRTFPLPPDAVQLDGPTRFAGLDGDALVVVDGAGPETRLVAGRFGRPTAGQGDGDAFVVTDGRTIVRVDAGRETARWTASARVRGVGLDGDGVRARVEPAGSWVTLRPGSETPVARGWEEAPDLLDGPPGQRLRSTHDLGLVEVRNAHGVVWLDAATGREWGRLEADGAVVAGGLTSSLDAPIPLGVPAPVALPAPLPGPPPEQLDPCRAELRVRGVEPPAACRDPSPPPRRLAGFLDEDLAGKSRNGADYLAPTWRLDTPDPVLHVAPLPDGRTAYTTRRGLGAVDGAGNPLWWVPFEAEEPWLAATSFGVVVDVGEEVWAVDADGAVRWRSARWLGWDDVDGDVALATWAEGRKREFGATRDRFALVDLLTGLPLPGVAAGGGALVEGVLHLRADGGPVLQRGKRECRIAPASGVATCAVAGEPGGRTPVALGRLALTWEDGAVLARTANGQVKWGMNGVSPYVLARVAPDRVLVRASVQDPCFMARPRGYYCVEDPNPYLLLDPRGGVRAAIGAGHLLPREGLLVGVRWGRLMGWVL